MFATPFRIGVGGVGIVSGFASTFCDVGGVGFFIAIGLEGGLCIWFTIGRSIGVRNANGLLDRRWVRIGFSIRLGSVRRSWRGPRRPDRFIRLTGRSRFLVRLTLSGSFLRTNHQYLRINDG